MRVPRLVCKQFLGVLGVLLLLIASSWADSDPLSSRCRLWLEPKFMRSPVAVPFASSKTVELTGGQLIDGELAHFGHGDLEAAGIDWDTFEKLARVNAWADLSKLRIRFERDRRHIITHARIDSDEPIVPSAVLVPGFLDLWKETLGEKVLVVIPNRNLAYLFPRLASDYTRLAPLILQAHRETAYPVSLEVFELSAEGWRCLGTFEERR